MKNRTTIISIYENQVFVNFLVCLFFLTFALGCGNSSSSSFNPDSTGSIAFNVKWPDSPAPQVTRNISRALNNPSIDCDGYNIETVTFKLYDSTGEEIRDQSWPCSRGEGTIDDIYPGSGYSLVVLGKDISGTILYRGERGNITVVGNQTFDVEEVETFIFTSTLLAPLITPDVDFEFQWNSVSGASEYNIVVSENRDLSNPIIDTTIANLTQNPSDNLYGIYYYWQVTPIDAYDNYGAGSDILGSPVINTAIVEQFGTTADDWGFDIAVDSNGNIYTTGYTEGDLNGESNNGGSDIFIMKCNSSGSLLWTRLLGTEFYDYGHGVDVDTAGNVYITGSVFGQIDENPAYGDHDVIIAKYDTDGTKVWTKILGSTAEDRGRDIVTDSSGASYITGFTFGNLDSHSNLGYNDVFIAKYDTDGDKLWTQILNSTGYEYAYGIDMDLSGNLYIGGDTNGNLAGSTNAESIDIFIAKYDSIGDNQWTTLLGSSGDDYLGDVGVDTFGNVFITGYTEDDLDQNVNAGGADIFVARYNTNGNKQWAQTFGTNKEDGGTGIALDADSNIYITGITDGNLNSIANEGSTDIFTAKYDIDGNKLWVHSLGTASEDAGPQIFVDADGTVFLTGYSNGDIDETGSTAGAKDTFIAKWLLPCNVKFCHQNTDYINGQAGQDEIIITRIRGPGGATVSNQMDGAYVVQGTYKLGSYNSGTISLNWGGTFYYSSLENYEINEAGSGLFTVKFTKTSGGVGNLFLQMTTGAADETVVLNAIPVNSSCS